MAASLPPGVDPSEVYNGPIPLHQQPPQQPQQQAAQRAQQIRAHQAYVATIAAAVDVISARFLALVSTLGAVAIFVWCCANPMDWRLYTAGTYAVVVLWPLVYLHLRKGG
jgi:hypothetical protein